MSVIAKDLKLLKIVKIIGLPQDLITLVEKWLNTRYYFFSTNGKHSTIRITHWGTVQKEKEKFLNIFNYFMLS